MREAEETGNSRPRFFGVGELEKLRCEKKRYFKLLATQFFPYAHGKVEWDKLVDLKRISDILSVSTEAFVILCIENSYDYWRKLCDQE